MSTEIIQDPEHLPPLRRSSSQPKPKGILKNAPPTGHQYSLQWDEANLALTEIQKDSLMKITEPKTPYVRYNAETDEVEGDIPNFDLGGFNASPPGTSALDDNSAPSSRRTSLSSAGRPSGSLSGGSGSGKSSRSTSFSVPDGIKSKIPKDGRDLGGEVESDDELDAEATAKHEAFLRLRNMHYKLEPLAKDALKAKNFDDEDDVDSSRTGSPPPVPDVHMQNGVNAHEP
ncbi:hypothetical protein FIBSPDRAFT_804601 [Athelia psychrophila]|uniref:Protein phosphatase inhibitor 2 (IPP-2) n=1 Tax=Athelia psychrophila TaxID=1759441 RepID=A0A167X1I5_9AGAM|nr:hypothetical protein FIBSPDRAFT_804601 [Fibularhizoctonia sp. CBS 109695]